MSIDRFWILVGRKLSGEASVEELSELEELLRIHPHLHFSIEIITNLWNQQPKKDEDQLETAYALHTARMKQMGILTQQESSPEDTELPYLIHGFRKSKIVRRISVAAAILIVVAAGILFSVNKKTTTAETANDSRLAVSTKNGSKTNIQLPDGSKVWLNSGSTLTYDKQFGHEIREVVLSGEAFFDVVKIFWFEKFDIRPFNVYLGSFFIFACT